MRYHGTVFPLRYEIHCRKILFLPQPKVNAITQRVYCLKPTQQPKVSVETELNQLQKLTDLGRSWGRKSLSKASAVVNYWWEKYEQFVGINEVREAQGNVAEAEKEFMVSRGIVREARENLEAQQLKLKEIRDRLDRVSREDIQYLELATLEHKLLQEERRCRTAHESAEDSEREKFSLFSAAVRESHEKERARAERTKNWSIIGSVLGAVIGVLGSTYINRVRLQELKALLLEAQKGPANLQDAIREQAAIHHLQQKELGDLITHLKSKGAETPQSEGGAKLSSTLQIPVLSEPLVAAVKEQLQNSEHTNAAVQGIKQKLQIVESSLSSMGQEIRGLKAAIQVRQADTTGYTSSFEQEESKLVKEDFILDLAAAEQRLKARINRNALYTTVLTYTAFAVTLPVLYFIFRSS
ncbi:mitochondrial potassium channel [Protopterus annectens]|uniref:mitochondrial potassium channel n=1 Tax=Protopterus annectens TaxID=7888 RepID=UPI001CF9C939|nr:mitochondrial potassium channel [Protopterus annectens]XP_043933958.1 mitochondrial potassium channel [Protopterus annectens]XP_043933959.1 mitochondrial potassium channel [Protopterus annectens]